jgi:hypothetical protein
LATRPYSAIGGEAYGSRVVARGDRDGASVIHGQPRDRDGVRELLREPRQRSEVIERGARGGDRQCDDLAALVGDGGRAYREAVAIERERDRVRAAAGARASAVDRVGLGEHLGEPHLRGAWGRHHLVGRTRHRAREAHGQRDHREQGSQHGRG